MDLQTFESILNCFFDRAVIALSYNAATRLSKQTSLAGINCIVCFILLRQIPRPASLSFASFPLPAMRMADSKAAATTAS